MRPPPSRFLGPLARVAVHAAGTVGLVLLAVTTVASHAAGLGWVWAVGFGLVTTALSGGFAVVVFRMEATRCSRWSQLYEDGTGQRLCLECWQVIAGPAGAGD